MRMTFKIKDNEKEAWRERGDVGKRGTWTCLIMENLIPFMGGGAGYGV